MPSHMRAGRAPSLEGNATRNFDRAGQRIVSEIKTSHPKPQAAFHCLKDVVTAADALEAARRKPAEEPIDDLIISALYWALSRKRRAYVDRVLRYVEERRGA